MSSPDGADAPGSERLFRLGLAGILACAAVLRGLYLAQTLGDPLLRDVTILDSRIYDALAARIAGGDWAAGGEAFALGPFYAYFLAALRACLGAGTAPIYAVQQLLGLASIALTALLARRCFGVGAALVAAALVGLYGAMAMLEVKVMASTLAVFLGLASLWLLLLARERSWRLLALAPGLVLGMTCLTRPNTLLFVPAAALWLWWDGRGKRAPGRRLPLARLPAALALAIGAGLAIAPVTLRNHAVSGEWILISSQGGITFYQANNERAQGLFTRLPGFVGNPSQLRSQARKQAEAELGRELSDSEVSRHWTRKGLAFLSGNPAKAAALEATKLRHWFGSDEFSTEYVLPVERELTPCLWAMPIPFGVILALAFLGMRGPGLFRPDRLLLGLFVALNLAAVLVFYFSSRYRLPAVPVLAVFAGGGAAAAVERFRGARRGFWLWLGPAILLAAFSLHSWNDHLETQGAQQLYNYGQIYYQRGDYAAAVAKYRAALETYDERWQLNLNLANALLQQGEDADALLEYERVLELQPDHPVARRRAGQLRERLGREPR